MTRGRLRRLARLSWAERARLLEACACLAGARVVLRFMPFDCVRAGLGRPHAESPLCLDNDKVRQQAREIGWSVTTMGRHAPWKSGCLDQAVACKLMLKRRGLASTLYLGLAHDEHASLKAHAWLRCGDLFLTGHSLSRHFTVVATFADAPRVDSRAGS